MKKICLWLLGLILVISPLFSLDFSSRLGISFWSDAIGFYVPVRAETRIGDSPFLLGMGGVVQGVVLEKGYILNGSAGFTFGYRWEVFDRFAIQPGVLGGFSLLQNTLYMGTQSVSMGMALIPEIELSYCITEEIGPVISLSFPLLFHSDRFVFIMGLSVGLVLDNGRPIIRQTNNNQNLSGKIETILKEADVKADVTTSKAGEIKLNFGNILFSLNSANIQPQYNQTIERIVKELKQYPKVNLKIEGYTDDTGEDQVNLVLSENRAKAVGELFLKYGFPSNRLTSKGFGKQNPVFPNTSDENREKNRRVEIRILLNE